MTVATRLQHVRLGNVLLETILYASESNNEYNMNMLAVFLHPWARLGGRMTDYVLQVLRPVFTKQGYNVLLFNSRGVGDSSGRASFTGFTEAHDLELLVRWAIDQITSVQNVVLMGYSHGSLIASLHPSFIHVESQQLSVYRILLSYPLAVRGFLTLFNSNNYETALVNAVRQTSGSRVLIIYGTEDQFTSSSKYRQWTKDLEGFGNRSSATLTIHEIEGADHFWHGEHSSHLCNLVETWLADLQ